MDKMDKMYQQNDYEIKMDGEYRKFDGGAVRYTKTGKGRFDLIPDETLDFICDYMLNYSNDLPKTVNRLTIISDIASGHIISAIVGIVMMKYGDHDLMNLADDEVVVDVTEITFDDIMFAFTRMLPDLAIHYEKGAAKYGENNWQKGIPEESFYDSGFRHTCQYLNGETDEPHHISAIWNFFCLLWVQDNS